MADQKITGTLAVTDKVGIGTENPLAKLHIASSTSAPSQAFLESGGALLKIRVDGNGASIGTDNAFPLSILTDDAPRLSITDDGMVGIGTNTTLTERLEVNGNVKAKSFLGNGSNLDGIVKKAGDTMTGALTVQNHLTVTGNVSFGDTDDDEVKITGVLRSGHSSDSLTVDGKLDVSGKIKGGGVLAGIWAAQPMTQAKVNTTNWQDVLDTSVTFELDRNAIIFCNYSINLRLGENYNPKEGKYGWVATRLHVDDKGYSQSFSHYSNKTSADVSYSTVVNLNGNLVLLLNKGEHIVKLQGISVGNLPRTSPPEWINGCPDGGFGDGGRTIVVMAFYQ